VTKARKHRTAPPPPRTATTPRRRSSLLSPSNIVLGLLALAAVVLTGAWVWQQVKPEPSLQDRLATASDGASDNVIAALQASDVTAAERVFLDKIHSVVHEIDYNLRQRNPQLGEQLWNAMLAVEAQFANERDATVLLTEMQQMKGLLTQARAAMGA
jgi:hypothetical protein